MGTAPQPSSNKIGNFDPPLTPENNTFKLCLEEKVAIGRYAAAPTPV